MRYWRYVIALWIADFMKIFGFVLVVIAVCGVIVMALPFLGLLLLGAIIWLISKATIDHCGMMKATLRPV